VYEEILLGRSGHDSPALVEIRVVVELAVEIASYLASTTRFARTRHSTSRTR